MNVKIWIIKFVLMNIFFLVTETEPLWMTLIAVVGFFICLFLFIIPAEVKRRRKEDQAYADKKGITLEKLYQRRTNQSARRMPKSLRDYIYQRDNFTCQYCGATEDLAIDHIYPFSRRGGNEPENLQLLCRSCNSAKGDSIPDEFKS